MADTVLLARSDRGIGYTRT